MPSKRDRDCVPPRSYKLAMRHTHRSAYRQVRSSHFYRRLRRLLLADYCSVFVPWLPATRRSAMYRIHRAASRHQFPRVPKVVGMVAKWLHFSLWPLQAAVLSHRMIQQYAADVTRRTGKAPLLQAWEQYMLALTQFVPPEAYYRYAFYEQQQRRQALDYIHNHEWASLSNQLNTSVCREALVDKQRFANICAEHDLASAPIFTCVTPETPLTQLPKQDLFVKPVRGLRAHGTAGFMYLRDGVYKRHDDVQFSKEALIHGLNKRAWRKALLVQPRIKNHTVIADLSPGGLCTVRIITGRWPNGQVDIVVATFKMPLENQLTSTYGLDSAIDLATGRLGRAYGYQPTDTGYDEHPSTGARVTARILPDWAHTLELVTQAHRVFTGCVLIGWDVALSQEGPLLLEGNTGWDVPTVQQPQRRPLGHTPMVPILQAHLDG